MKAMGDGAAPQFDANSTANPSVEMQPVVTPLQGRRR